MSKISREIRSAPMKLYCWTTENREPWRTQSIKKSTSISKNVWPNPKRFGPHVVRKLASLLSTLVLLDHKLGVKWRACNSWCTNLVTSATVLLLGVSCKYCLYVQSTRVALFQVDDTPWWSRKTYANTFYLRPYALRVACVTCSISFQMRILYYSLVQKISVLTNIPFFSLVTKSMFMAAQSLLHPPTCNSNSVVRLWNFKSNSFCCLVLQSSSHFYTFFCDSNIILCQFFQLSKFETDHRWGKGTVSILVNFPWIWKASWKSLKKWNEPFLFFGGNIHVDKNEMWL